MGIKMKKHTMNTEKTKDKAHDTNCTFVFPEEIVREVREYTDNISKIYKRTVDILEYDFEGFYNYFIEILEQEYDYVILMSRRCLVFFQLFTYLYVYDKKEIKSKSVILSDKAIPFYFNLFKHTDRIAVVDDIIVHGRTVYSIYNMFQEMFPEIKVDIYGYVSEEKLDCLPTGLIKSLNISYFANANEWRLLSNNIVSCILMSNIPYTSFVTAFYQYNNPSSWEFLRNKSFIVVPNTKDSQVHEGTDSYCIYEQNWNKPDLFSSLSLGECIRLYWNKYTEKLTIIPYVFIRSLSAEQAETAIDYVYNLLPDDYSNIKLFFHKKEEDPNRKKSLEEFKMRILTCLLSSYYWISFLERHLLPNPQYVDIDTLSKSFGEPIARELGKIKPDLFNNVTTVPFTECSNEKTKNTAEQSTIKQDFDTLLSNLLYDAWVTDEKRAKERKCRARGYTIDEILMQGRETKLDDCHIMSKLINSWDTGLAAANFSFDPNTNDIGCFVASGEQSYKILLENNANIMYALITVSNMVTRGDAEKHSSSFEDYRMQLLKELLDEFNSYRQLQDYSKIESIIENTKGYLNAWDQPIIWESNMSEENKKIMSDFIDKKF
ncbi:MAG: hypothetical protein HFH06_01285 [Lachnospiraceae bacterium]|nr:hypothetical protein [Lachnospiraceae bacterium]